MREMLMWLAMVSVCAMPTVGCDDDGPSVGPDTSADLTEDQPTSDTVTPPPECYTARTGDTFIIEPLGENEYSDCITGCDHDPNPYIIDLAVMGADGIRARMDGEPHRFSSVGVEAGPDIDLIGVQAPARTMVEIIVEKTTEASTMNALVQTRDGFRNGSLTFSSDMAEGVLTARTVLAAPYAGNLPFYIVVEHEANYEKLRGIDAPTATYEGGATYDYLVRFRTWDFAPVELGTLDAENPTLTVASAELECGGDIHYYRFYGQSGIAPTVRFERTGSADFVGAVSGMNTGPAGEQLVWTRTVNDSTDATPGDGVVILLGEELIDQGSGEFIFAVTDYNGLSYPGDFTYSLTVTL